MEPERSKIVDKVPDIEEVNPVVRAARGRNAAAGPTPGGPSVTAWDPRQTGQIGGEQMRSINTLHESFARNLTHTLGAYLRVAFQAELVSAEYLEYGNFLQRVSGVTYLASCHLLPVGATALLQLDLAVAFTLLDVLLGGEGKGAPPVREITEIEEQILETVVRIICRELQAAWQAISLEFQFDQRQQPEQVQRLMALDEKTLCLSFELTMAETRGTLNLAVPAVVSNALLRKISSEWVSTRPRTDVHAGRRLRSRLLECEFPVELSMASVPVPVRDLMELKPGSLLITRRRAEPPASLLVSQRELFTALPVRRGPLRAAQVLEQCPLPKLERKSRL